MIRLVFIRTKKPDHRPGTEHVLYVENPLTERIVIQAMALRGYTLKGEKRG